MMSAAAWCSEPEGQPDPPQAPGCAGPSASRPAPPAGHLPASEEGPQAPAGASAGVRLAAALALVHALLEPTQLAEM